jgi:hypothetical protein
MYAVNSYPYKKLTAQIMRLGGVGLEDRRS